MDIAEIENSRWKRWGKRMLWTFAGIALLVLLFRLSLKTKVVHNWVKNSIVSTANGQMKGTLHIDGLSGDLWKQVTLSGIQLNMNQDTLASIDSVHAAYNVWSLLEGRLEVPGLNFYRPQLKLREQEGGWNVQDIMVERTDSSPAGSVFPFQLSSFRLHNGAIAVHSESLPIGPDVSIQDLSISSSFRYGAGTYSLNLQNLSFQLRQTNIEGPLHFETSAKARNEQISLEKLVLATGNSMIRSSAYISPGDTTVDFKMMAQPLSWKDVLDYAKDMPLRQDVRFDLGLEGSPQKFSLTLNMQAEGLESLKLNSRFRWGESIILEQLSTEVKQFSPSVLLADADLPAVEYFSSNFSGQVALSDYQKGRGDLRFSGKNISLASYKVDQLSGSGQIKHSEAKLDFNIQKKQQKLAANVKAAQIWTDLPSVRASIKASGIDPGYWVRDTTMTGNISFKSTISGEGWYPQKRPWNYSLEMQDSRWMGQPISKLSLSGKMSAKNASIKGEARIRKGLLNISADVKDMATTPSYSYRLQTRQLDLAALMGMPDFDSTLNSEISGKGRGIDMNNLQLQSSLQVDSSYVNGELIQNLFADFRVRDSIAVVDSARLRSTIASGSFSGRMNLLQEYDPENELSLKIEFKDIKALAPLAEVEKLNAVGELTGKLRPIEKKQLRFTGAFDFTDLVYGTMFSAKRARGSLDTHIREGLEYKADLNLSSPVFSGVRIQDLNLQSRGSYKNSHADGDFNLQFSSPNEGRIEHRGEYWVSSDSVRLRTTEYNIISDYRMLSLESPFNLTVEGNTLKMERMRVSSGDGAFFALEIPMLSSQEQHIFIQGKALNTAVMQSCLLGETYFKGLLSGRMEFSRRDTNLQAGGQLSLTNVRYKETSFDSLLIQGDIADERMKGTLTVRHEGEKLIEGQANLPFRLGDPETFPDTFFKEQVNGKLNVRDISIARFESIFAEAGITNTSGLFSFRGILEGQAGSPRFTADASVKKAVLSGVSVDSVTAGLAYNHENRKLNLNASVMSLRQKAAEIVAEFPLYIDMKTFGVDLPQEGDTISVDVTTSNFNLAALNDFVDRRTLRNVRGRLDGSVEIAGPLGNLHTDGQLRLRKGGFRFLPAGITVDHLKTTLGFKTDKMRLTEFSAESGKGKMTASGTVGLSDLIPDALNIGIKAKNFRVANTSQYNAVINMDTRLSGRVKQPKVTGNIDFISGFIKLDNFGEKSVERVQLDSLEEAESSFAFYDSLALDMDVSFNRRFYIRNQRYLEMEIELQGTLDLLKDKGKDLQLFGTMNAPGGYARPFGKEFRLVEGRVIFSGNPTNPQLMIRTQYKPPQTQQEIVIWYIIEGTVEKPQFKYESQPPMELENIISYTLFGQPFYALDSWKQVVAGSGNTSAANVALDVLLDRVEALATQKLGIDVVKIDNTQVGGETGTSITTGWYLNPRVFFAMQNVITGSTPDTSFILEYLLRENLKLIIRQGNGIRQGIDIKWFYDY